MMEKVNEALNAFLDRKTRDILKKAKEAFLKEVTEFIDYQAAYGMTKEEHERRELKDGYDGYDG